MKSKNGISKVCSRCNEEKLLSEFYKDGRSYCKKCNNIYSKEYAIKNREKRNNRLREYRKKYPEKAKLYDARGRYKKIYGLSYEQRNEMILNQNNKCYICKKETTKLVVDHSHESGKVRKMLCYKCNILIGVYEFNKAIINEFDKYINEHK
jgi:hypothetical protein